MFGDIVWAVITGTVLGYLAKLLLPGKQDIPAWSTIGAGIVAALAAALIAVYFTARVMGGRRTSRRGAVNY